MSNRAKTPRLAIRKRNGRKPTFVICDRGREIATGCGLAQSGEAARALEDYIAKKQLQALSRRLPSKVTILTRRQVAALLWTCWRTRDANGPTPHPWRHLCRYILLSVYTGARSGTVLAGSFAAAPERSHIDIEAGGMHRLEKGRRESRRRQRPAPLCNRLLAHLRRWQRTSDHIHVVTLRGRPVRSVAKAFSNAVRQAGLPNDVRPHTLRRTFLAWMRAGCSPPRTPAPHPPLGTVPPTDAGPVS